MVKNQKRKARKAKHLVPDLTGFCLEDAKQILDREGFEAKLISKKSRPDSIIILHEPMGGDLAYLKTTIEILAE